MIGVGSQWLLWLVCLERPWFCTKDIAVIKEMRKKVGCCYLVTIFTLNYQEWFNGIKVKDIANILHTTIFEMYYKLFCDTRLNLIRAPNKPKC